MKSRGRSDPGKMIDPVRLYLIANTTDRFMVTDVDLEIGGVRGHAFFLHVNAINVPPVF
jgi:hypothetical protein